MLARRPAEDGRPSDTLGFPGSLKPEATPGELAGQANMIAGRILVVEDDENLRRVTSANLQKSGYETFAARDVVEALEFLHAQHVHLVLTDLNLPGESGLDLLRKVRLDYPETVVVLITAFGSVETAVEAMRSGAYDYLTKPVNPEALRALVRRVFERQQLMDEVKHLRSAVHQKYGFENIIGRSGKFLNVIETAARVAATNATILIRGETGTGKEVLAKAIHFNSPRRSYPFAVINCGSIPRELLESELFGYAKGAFTGALTHKMGKVEAANGGTVFLDEIGEMPLDLQVRMLRLVQEHEIEKVGGVSRTKVDVRIIAATHRNLEAMVADGTFREDLYYRLAVIPITIPPLRERADDIPDFVLEFFTRSKNKHQRPGMRLPDSLMPYFVNYRWPGNVRELENVIEWLVLMSRSEEVTVDDLPECLNPRRSAAPARSPTAPGFTSLADAERRLIVDALKECNGNRAKAARQLKISRKTLLCRIAKHGIRIEGAEVEAAAWEPDSEEGQRGEGETTYSSR
jgi:DNA-binding NtrC family response regulator